MAGSPLEPGGAELDVIAATAAMRDGAHHTGAP